MGYPVGGGAANYPATGASNTSKFIPEIWSGKLVEKFYNATVFGDIANTDYEGEISSYGDKVYIRTVPDLTVSDYTKGGGLTYQNPESANVELLINKGKYFAFNLWDVDKYQSDLNLMNTFAEDGGEQIKIAVDTDVLGSVFTSVAAQNAGGTAGAGSNINLGTNLTPRAITKTDVVDFIVDAGQILDEQNIPESGRYIVLPPGMASRIKKSELKDASLAGDGTSMLRNGRLGMVDRFTIYSSNSVSQTEVGEYDVIFGHPSALTFAGQITAMEDMPNPDDFGQLVRSLFVYGFSVIKPDAMGHAVCTLA